MSGLQQCKYCTFQTVLAEELQDHELSHENEIEDDDQLFQLMTRSET